MNSFKSWNSKSNLSSDATKVIFWKNYFNSCFRKGERNLTILKGGESGDVKSKWNHTGETSAFYSTQIISFLKNVVKAWKTWTLLTFRDSINNSLIARLRDLQDFVPLKSTGDNNARFFLIKNAFQSWVKQILLTFKILCIYIYIRFRIKLCKNRENRLILVKKNIKM